MKKLLSIIGIMLLTVTSSQAQFSFDFNWADSSWTNFGGFTHKTLYVQKDSSANPDSDYFKFYTNIISASRLNSTHNDGRPNSIVWATNSNGELRRSPIDSIYINHYYTKVESDNRFVRPLGTTSQYVRGDGSLATFPTIPTNTNQLTNGSGFISTSSTDVLTNKSGNISQWNNDSGYLTGVTSLQVTTALGFTPISSSYTGFDSRYVALSGSYTNPSWLVSLPNTKITYSGTTAQYVRGDGSISTLAPVPTNTNQLTNGSGFITASSTDALTNKSGNISQWTNNSGYLIANQTITLSGDVAGSGTTNITTTLPASGVVAGTYEYITVNSKGIVTGGYNSVNNILSSRTFGTAYQASSTTRTYDVDFTVQINIGAGLISTSNGQVTLEISANGSTGWVEYTRSQNINIGVLAAQNGQAAYIEAKNIPAGYYYRLVSTTNAGTVSYTYIEGHETLKR